MPQLPKEPTVEWRHRESERLISGRYEKVPWHGQNFHQRSPIYSMHYAHIDMDGKGMVSFTPDERRGEADSQTIMKVRKYLRLTFTEFMKETYSYNESSMDKFVEDWACKLLMQVAKTPVLLAMNPEHIRWVLEHSRNIRNADADPDDTPTALKDRGCPSCMTYLPERYQCRPIMPCEIMGYGDLAISHVVDPENPMLVKARCIVWPEKKLTCGYIKGRDGWEDKLRVGLKALGYVEGDMFGAKMYRWVHPNSKHKLVAPYLDFNGRVKDCDTYLLITDGDGYSAGNTDGTFSDGETDWYCHSCDEGFTEDDWSCIPFDDRVCETCYNEYYMTCERCDEHGMQDESRTVGDDVWCESCADAYAFNCYGCGENVDLNDTAGTYNGDDMCEECFNEDDDLYRKDCGSIVKIQTEIVTVAKCDCCDNEELTREEA